MPPKTFERASDEPLKLLLLPQRVACALELVDAVVRRKPLGVRLSGPNGVGKSSVGLLAYLLCAARGLPSVYISQSASWVTAAREPGGGDVFLLKKFWAQNADLILREPSLRRIFRAALLDAEAPFSAGVMEMLRDAVVSFTAPGLAVISDEVQHITAEVYAANVKNPAPEVQRAGRYF